MRTRNRKCGEGDRKVRRKERKTNARRAKASQVIGYYCYLLRVRDGISKTRKFKGRKNKRNQTL